MPEKPDTAETDLTRGLRALELVARAQDGMSTEEVADGIGVDPATAETLLSTLADNRLVTRGADGRHRAGVGLTALAAGIRATLRAAAEPIMRELAEELGATVSLIVAEGSEAVALAVVDPPNATNALAANTGRRHPIGRGSAGVALLAAQPSLPGEAETVTRARHLGYAETYGEVEPGAYGVAVPLRVADGVPAACLNLITHRAEVAHGAAPRLVAGAARIAAALA